MADVLVPPWRQCLYRSRLAEGRGYEVFARLARCARTRNAAEGTGGCLLFDGQRFCQLIEGPAAAVSALWTRIALDARHREVELLLERRLDWPAHGPPPWDYGYCAPDDLDCFERRPAPVQGVPALAAFDLIRAGADLAR